MEIGFLVWRVGLSVIMLAAHGWPKLVGFSARAGTFPDPLGVGPEISLSLAILAEVFCSLFVALGLFTRLSCIPLIVTMAMAAFVIHGADPWARKELAVLYLIGFSSLFVAGGGSYSLQRALKISSSSSVPFVSWLLR